MRGADKLRPFMPGKYPNLKDNNEIMRRNRTFLDYLLWSVSIRREDISKGTDT